jgi:hypothetical protein
MLHENPSRTPVVPIPPVKGKRRWFKSVAERNAFALATLFLILWPFISLWRYFFSMIRI